MTKDFLYYIDQALSDVYKVNTHKVLREDKKSGRQEIKYKSQGKQLVFSFDINSEGIDPPFPFFKDVEGLNSVSDYILFTIRTSDSKPFILIFELKKTKLPKKQLLATEQLCIFIINRINSVFHVNLQPEIRMIGLVENIKTGTKIDKLEYKNKLLYTPLRVLDIAKLLK